MKLKRKIGISLAVVATTYCVLAYIFMWPPVVVYRSTAAIGDPCVDNLRHLDSAIKQFALEQNKITGDIVTLADLTPYIKLNSHHEIPECPQGGKYSVTVVGVKPTCSLGSKYPLETLEIRRTGLTWQYNSPMGIIHQLP